MDNSNNTLDHMFDMIQGMLGITERVELYSRTMSGVGYGKRRKGGVIIYQTAEQHQAVLDYKQEMVDKYFPIFRLKMRRSSIHPLLGAHLQKEREMPIMIMGTGSGEDELMKEIYLAANKADSDLLGVIRNEPTEIGEFDSPLGFKVSPAGSARIGFPRFHYPLDTQDLFIGDLAKRKKPEVEIDQKLQRKDELRGKGYIRPSGEKGGFRKKTGSRFTKPKKKRK